MRTNRTFAIVNTSTRTQVRLNAITRRSQITSRRQNTNLLYVRHKTFTRFSPSTISNRVRPMRPLPTKRSTRTDHTATSITINRLRPLSSRIRSLHKLSTSHRQITSGRRRTNLTLTISRNNNNSISRHNTLLTTFIPHTQSTVRTRLTVLQPRSLIRSRPVIKVTTTE